MNGEPKAGRGLFYDSAALCLRLSHWCLVSLSGVCNSAQKFVC